MHIYEEINDYLIGCVTNKEELSILLDELAPLLNQVNYRGLSTDNLHEVHTQLGLGEQALLICNNILVLYLCNHWEFKPNISAALYDTEVFDVATKDPNYAWIIAGTLLMGSGVIRNLREAISDINKE